MQREITKRPLTTVVTTSCWSTTNPTHQILQTHVTKPTTVGGPRLANCHNAPSQANAPRLPGTLDHRRARTPKGTNARIANRTSARNQTKTPRWSRKCSMGRTTHCQAMGPNLVNRIQSMMTAQTHKTTRVTTTTEGGKEKDARRRETSCGSTHPGMMQLRPTSVKGFWTSCHYTFQKDTPCARS